MVHLITRILIAYGNPTSTILLTSALGIILIGSSPGSYSTAVQLNQPLQGTITRL